MERTGQGTGEIWRRTTSSNVDPYPWLSDVQRALKQWVETQAATAQWIDEGSRAYDRSTFVLAARGAFDWGGPRTVRMDVHTHENGGFDIGGIWAGDVHGSGINPDELSLHYFLDPIVQSFMTQATEPPATAAVQPADPWYGADDPPVSSASVDSSQWADEDANAVDAPQSWEERADETSPYYYETVGQASVDTWDEPGDPPVSVVDVDNSKWADEEDDSNVPNSWEDG